MTKLLSLAVTSAATGVLLAVLGFMYVCTKLRISPWILPKFWFFFTVGVVTIGITLEIWLARRKRHEDTPDDEQLL